MTSGAKSENRLLQLVPPAERNRLMRHMSRISPASGEVVYQPGQRIEWVYFPVTAVASLLIVMETGQAVDSAAVGSEGMLGLPLLAGTGRSPERVVWHVDGEAWRLPAEHLARQWRAGSRLQQLVVQYILARLQQVHQTCACNLLHSLEERMCNWLLTTRDRVGADEFHLTQAFLADMLGVHRPTVSLAASALQRVGFITYRRGWVKILDHSGLSDASCECYRAVRRYYESLFGAFNE